MKFGQVVSGEHGQMDRWTDGWIDDGQGVITTGYLEPLAQVS